MINRVFIKKILPALIIQVCIYFLYFLHREGKIFFSEEIKISLNLLENFNIFLIGFLASYKSERPILYALLAGVVLYFILIPILVVLEGLSLLFNTQLSVNDFWVAILGIYISSLLHSPLIIAFTTISGIVNKLLRNGD